MHDAFGGQRPVDPTAPLPAGPTAILLSGGGALGAFEVGVLEALQSGRWAHGRLGTVSAQMYSGVSVGAFNAAFLASHGGDFRTAVRDLCRVWLTRIAQWPGHANGAIRFAGRSPMLLSLLYGLDTLIGLIAEPPARETTLRHGLVAALSSPAGRALQGLVNPMRYISSQPLARLISRTLDLDRLLSRRAKPLLIAATEWRTGRPTLFYNRADLEARFRFLKYFSTRLMTPATAFASIRASAAVPGVVPPVDVGGRLFSDGSLLVTLPIQSAVDLGARVVHTVTVQRPPSSMAPDGLPSTVQALEQVLSSAGAFQIRKDLNLTATLNALSHSIRKADSILRDSMDGSLLDILAALAERYQVTVHLHYPQENLTGLLNALDFQRGQLTHLMSLGFEAAVAHDCAKAGCLLPKTQSSLQPQPARPHAGATPGPATSRSGDRQRQPRSR